VHARSVRFPLMDSLRAIAALAVVGTHAAFFSQALVHWDTLRALAARLDVGVTIFFLISGFLRSRAPTRGAACCGSCPRTGPP
jgi:peptidoglycan/LPS O-acetylase OafA/YrhL